MVNQKSFHFSHSQHKTPNRDAFNLLVLFGTRWQDKREVLEVGYSVSAFSLLTHSYVNLGKASKSWMVLGSLLHPRHYDHSKLIVGFQGGDWGAGIFQNSTRLHSHTQYPLGLFWQMLVTTSLREPLKTY